MSKALPAIGVTAVAVVAVERIGDGPARDALAAIEITVAVVITLAVLGMLAMLVYRVRHPRLTYRPDPGIRAYVTRAEVLGTTSRPTPRALPAVPERDARELADPSRAHGLTTSGAWSTGSSANSRKRYR